MRVCEVRSVNLLVVFLASSFEVYKNESQQCLMLKRKACLFASGCLSMSSK